MSKDNYTRRIVESPLFGDCAGAFIRISGERAVVFHCDDEGGLDVLLAPRGPQCPPRGRVGVEWHEADLGCDHPATQALLIYMLSKHCAWAKLDGESVLIGYLIKSSNDTWDRGYAWRAHRVTGGTLAETFAQAFAYVEGLQ